MILPAIKKVRDGELSAFGDLYDASYDKIYAFIYHRTLDDIATEDIVSDVYMKALKGIGSFHGNSEGEYFSWIYRIAYTTLLDSVKGAKFTDSLDEMEIEPGIEENKAEMVDNRSKLEEILQFMQTFSERDRLIIKMRIWDDLSYEEISEITGESIANSKKIVSRGLTKISANIVQLFIFSFIINYVITR